MVQFENNNRIILILSAGFLYISILLFLYFLVIRRHLPNSIIRRSKEIGEKKCKVLKRIEIKRKYFGGYVLNNEDYPIIFEGKLSREEFECRCAQIRKGLDSLSMGLIWSCIPFVALLVSFGLFFIFTAIPGSIHICARDYSVSCALVKFSVFLGLSLIFWFLSIFILWYQEKDLNTLLEDVSCHLNYTDNGKNLNWTVGIDRESDTFSFGNQSRGAGLVHFIEIELYDS